MRTDLNELLKMAETPGEREGLNQMITMMLHMRQMIRIRSSEDKSRQK